MRQPKRIPILKGSETPASEDAYLRGLNLLARRDHGTAELRNKLKTKGFSPEAINLAVLRLSDQGLLDDAKFSARWVDSALRNGRGYGARLLQELLRKGIPGEIAQLAVSEAGAENSSEQVLASIIAKRFAAFNHDGATLKERQRVYSYLQRRGFSLSDIMNYFRLLRLESLENEQI